VIRDSWGPVWREARGGDLLPSFRTKLNMISYCGKGEEHVEEMNAQRLNIIRDGKSLMGTSELYYRPLKMGVAIEGVPWVFNFEWHETNTMTLTAGEA
jgi:hypothetical protein